MKDHREICGNCKYHLYGVIYDGDNVRKGWQCELDGYETDYEDSCDEYEAKEC